MKRLKIPALMLSMTLLTTLLVVGSAFGYVVTTDTQRRATTVSPDAVQAFDSVLTELWLASEQGRRSRANTYTGSGSWWFSHGVGGDDSKGGPSAPVPEPGTMLLLGISAAAGAGYFLRRAKKI